MRLKQKQNHGARTRTNTHFKTHVQENVLKQPGIFERHKFHFLQKGQYVQVLTEWGKYESKPIQA